MANHIFTVNETTFNIHLRYMFAGTGKWNWTEGSDHQHGALTDILALREWDNILFYVEWCWFYGVFSVVSFDDDGRCVFYEYASKQKFTEELEGKTLTYRSLIKWSEQYGVFENGISEWNMIENPTNIEEEKIKNMQWSWIFKKLKGNRWCLSIPDDEFEKMIWILSKNNQILNSKKNSFSFESGKIIVSELDNTYPEISTENAEKEIYSQLKKIKIELDVQKFFTSQAWINKIFEKIIHNKITTIQNEIKCSFWDKSIDLLISTDNNDCYLIELKKDFCYSESIANQIYVYSRWITTYKSHNRAFPILIIGEPREVSAKKWGKYFKFLSEEDKEKQIYTDWYNYIISSLKEFKTQLVNENINKLEPLKIFTYKVDEEENIVDFIELI